MVSPPRSCMPCTGSARFLGGVPSPVACSIPPPPSPACRALVAHAHRGVPLCPPWGSGSPPSPACCALGAHAARVVPPPPPPVSGFVPLPHRHAVRWERKLPFGGVPPFIRDRAARCGCARYVPRPLLPARGLCALLGMGAPSSSSSSWARSRGRVPCCCDQGSPPRAPTARRGRALLGGGFPSPFPPSMVARVKRV